MSRVRDAGDDFGGAVGAVDAAGGDAAAGRLRVVRRRRVGVRRRRKELRRGNAIGDEAWHHGTRTSELCGDRGAARSVRVR